MLLGKSARNNDNEADKAEKPIVTGAIYIKLDETLENKAGQPYVVKVDYYGGNMKADDAVNGGSYIDLCHNSSAGNNTKVRNTYGTTWQLNADATMYHELPEADFAENIGSCGADFRLETWTGATLRIRRISVLSYEPLEIPEMTEVDPGKTIATGDFGDLWERHRKLTNGVLTGVVQGNGLSLVTTESTGNTRGSNILEDGYLLLGKEARQNDNPADMASKPKVTGAAYFKLDTAIADKEKQAYAVKIEYFGGGLSVDRGSYIDFCYNSQDGTANKKERNTYGDTYNSGSVETMYYLIPNADFAEDVGGCKADFRLETWTGAQLKLRSVSVVAYDPAEITDKADAPALFENSEAVAGIDFSNIDAPAFDPYTDEILNGEIVFDGLTILTNVDNNNSRASNRVTSDGYMLLGKAARINTLTGTGANQGRIYVRLDEDAEMKAGKRYVVKVEYLDTLAATVPDATYGIASESNQINAGSYLELHYSDGNGKNDLAKKLTFGDGNFNTDTVRTMYFLLPDAVFEGKVADGGMNKGAISGWIRTATELN